MKHVLVIGGTGMLRNVSLHLAKECIVSVIARSGSRKLKHIVKKGIKGIEVDYSDLQDLEEKLKNQIEQFGPFDLVISWIHEHAIDAHKVIVDLIEKNRVPCRYFDIMGSVRIGEIKKKLKVNPYEEYQFVKYRKVLLGHIGSRWLTHDEISSGVIKAVEEDKEVLIIGEL